MRYSPLLGLLIAGAPALAEDRFMPTGLCTQVAGFDSEAEHRAMERYLYFAVSTMLKTTLPDTPETYAELRRRTGAVCVEMPYGTSIEEAVIALVDGPGTPAPAPATSALEQEARSLLEAFLQPGADRAAMTLALKPTLAELSAIYKPNVVPFMAQYVSEVFGSGMIGPKPDQTEVLIVMATTSDLIDGAPVLQEFPGGYGDLRPYLQRDIPVVRFKFVKPGETLGMAFDGLFKVGDRWVMIPKSWRALPQ